MAGYRIDRISEDIKREIVAVMRELKDPRVQGKLLTVVKVEVSSDASFAKVFVSSMSGIDDAKTAVKGLDSAMGYIRAQIRSAQDPGAQICRRRLDRARHEYRSYAR